MARKQTKEAIAFGEVLRDQRNQRGITQERLGELSELHPKYISLMERGLRQPSLGTIIQLASALGMSASALIMQVEEDLEF